MKRSLILLLLCVAAQSVLGLVMLDSTVLKHADAVRYHSQQLYLATGQVLLPLLVFFNYRWLERQAGLWMLGGTGVALLLAVLLPGVGVESHGARRWLPGLGQPSEFVKPLLVVLLAAWFARLGGEKIRHFKEGFLIPMLIGGVPALLVFAEPDWGSAVLFMTLTLAMLLLAGARWSHLAITGASAVSLLAILVSLNRLRLLRFLVFLDPEAYRQGLGWQVWQSLLAIGSGGLGGQFMGGSLHKYGFVPEQQTDFIFSCIGEELGLWGTSLVLLLYLGILLCGLHIMKQARDRFGCFVAAGCTTIITLQACINIAVATSLVPNKGLALPFISYGGSSFLAMYVCAGLLGSVAWHTAREEVPEPVEDGALATVPPLVPSPAGPSGS